MRFSLLKNLSEKLIFTCLKRKQFRLETVALSGTTTLVP